MSVQDDSLLREALHLTSPVRDLVVPPLTVSAAELRRMVQRRAAPARSRRQRSRRLTAALAAGLAAIVASVVAFVVNSAPAVAAPAPLQMDTSDHPPAAAGWLAGTAQRLSGTSPTDFGVNTHIHLQRWAMDTTSPGLQIIALDEESWWRPDRSAVTAITELPPQPAGKQTAQWLLGPPGGSDTTIKRYPPGAYSTAIDTPSAVPETLARQLATHEPVSNGPQATVRAVAAIHQYHHLAALQRIAALRVLSQVSGLALRGPTTDRAGRPGIAVSIDSFTKPAGSFRDILVYDIEGRLLSHEQIMLTPPANSPIPPYTVVAYTLYLSSSHTNGDPP